MENKLKFDFIKMFSQTKTMEEIFTGKVQENNLDYRVLFRCMPRTLPSCRSLFSCLSSLVLT